MSEPETKFESWCIVEIFGHSRYAGLVTEQTIGGCSFVRIDVPEVPAEVHYDARPAFTKLFTQGAIFSITPCTEATAREAARQMRSLALTMFEIPSVRRIATDERPGYDEDDEPY